MPDVQTYRKLPVEIKAIELTQYGDFVRAAQWILDNGGKCWFSPSDDPEIGDKLIIQTLEGDMEFGVGWFVIQGVKGEFYGCESEIFWLTYEALQAAAEPDANDALYDSLGIGSPRVPSQGGLRAEAPLPS